MKWIRDQKEREGRHKPPSLGQKLVNAYWDYYCGYWLDAGEALEEIALIVTEDHERPDNGVKKISETMAKGEDGERGYEPYKYSPSKWA